MKKTNTGYTLIELMVTVAILSIITFIAVPGVGTAIQGNRIKSSANNLYSLFIFARAEAARKGIIVTVGAIDNNWAKGAVAWIDDDGDALFDAAKDTELRRTVPGYDLDVVEANNISKVTINGRGYLSSALAIGFCDDKTGTKDKQLRVLLSGVAIVAEKEDC